MCPNERIVVGIDGSESAKQALEWAADEARRRSLAVHVIHAWRVPLLVAGPASAVAIPTMAQLASHRAQFIVDAALEELQQRGIDATGEAVEQHPVDALISAGRHADQIVVGDRGARAAARFFLGSVSSAVVHHAPGPVTVVRDDGARSARHQVVVGVDLSGTSLLALARAAVEADARDAKVRVVAAWQLASPDLLDDFAGLKLPPLDELEAHATARVNAAVEQALPDRDNVQVDIVHGPPASALLSAAADADLLVLGSRGLGAFDRLLLGSTTTACLHHSPCTVQVVPAANR